MKNFILAITSFMMAVLFFSQVALAEDSADGFPPRTEDKIDKSEWPETNAKSGRSQTPQDPEGYAPSSFQEKPCNDCEKHRVGVSNLSKPSNPAARGSSGAPASGRVEGTN